MNTKPLTAALGTAFVLCVAMPAAVSFSKSGAAANVTAVTKPRTGTRQRKLPLDSSGEAPQDVTGVIRATGLNGLRIYSGFRGGNRCSYRAWRGFWPTVCPSVSC